MAGNETTQNVDVQPITEVSKDTKPTTIDWSTVEIPEEIIRSTPAYKSVLNESVERRQKIAALKAQVDELSGEKAADKPKDTPVTEVSPEISALQQAIIELKQEVQKDKLSSVREDAIKTYQIPKTLEKFVTGDDATSILQAAKDLAVGLGTIPAKPATTAAGIPGFGAGSDVERAQLINNKIHGRGDTNPFSVETQTRADGGPISGNIE